MGLLQPDRTILWNKPEDAESIIGEGIAKAVLAGNPAGKIRTPDAGCEWGLFLGDGPLESRVSDWAKTT